MKKIICGLICVLSFSLLSASSTMGQLIWNAGNSSWFTPTNWTPPGPPTSSDDAQINNGGRALITAGAATANRLTLGSDTMDLGAVTVSASSLTTFEMILGFSGQGSMIVQNAGGVSAVGATIANLSGSTGSLNIQDAGSTFTTGMFNLIVGNGGTGSLTVENGGAASSGFGFLGGNTGSTGTGIVTGVGSMWSITNDLFVAELGTATLNITSGGKVTDNDGTIGDGAGSNGFLYVDGAGSTWTNSGNVRVGNAGNGALHILNGGVVSDTNGIIGGDEAFQSVTTGVGVVTVDGTGSKWTNSGSLEVGSIGMGTLSITNGGMVSNTFALIGRFGTATGMVTVDGAGSTWANSTFLTVGLIGNATLDITNGGVVSDTSFGTIASAGGVSTVTVDGAGSMWTNGGNLFVGENGNGTLNITNGGKVSNTFSNIGVFSTATGTVNVDGAGSTWTNNGDLTVADFTTGTLNIMNGGTVSNTRGFIAGNPGDSGPSELSVGTVNVDGAGSTWTNSSSLMVGELGNGALHISNGGVVSNTSSEIGDMPGSTGAVTVDGAGSMWTNTGTFDVGLDGNGTLNITNGGNVIVNGAFARIAEHATSTSSVTVDGSGSTWTLAGELDVARDGTGTLTIQNGGTVNMTGAGRASIGVDAGSSGMVTVDGAGSTFTDGGGLFVGNSGNGTLNITNGGAVSNVMQGTIGNDATSTGTVTVDGSGSKWTNSASLFVSINGTATLNIMNGGAVSNVNGNISGGSGSGTVNVDGLGSTWTNSGGLSVGVAGTIPAGTATLNITNQGAVLVAMGSLMSVDGGTSVANVDGVGSKWMNGAELQVGVAGNATLNIINGGAVTNTDGLIATGTGSNGRVIVDGAGSTWTNSGNVYVGGTSAGPAGTGLLRIENGGTVSASSTTVWSSGTLEIGVNPILSGTLFFVGGTLRTIADTTFPNQIILGGSGILVDSNGFDSTLSGPINGVVGGMTKVNPGTIILTNTDTVPDGTNIFGGVLQVDGSLTSNVVVKTEGTLAGTGTIVGNVDNNGIVSPGDSPGTFTITGNYMQNASGILRIEIGGLNSGVNSDLLSVGNVATLAIGSTLQLLQFNNFHPLPGDQVTILTATNGVQGEFSTVTDNFGTVVHPTLVYNSNDVMVLFVQGSFNLGGLTFNQSAVAHELDEVAADPRAMDLIDFLDTEPMGNLPHDYELIAPEELASIYEIGFSQAVVSNMNLQHRMDDIRAGSTGFCANGYQARETSGYSKDSDGSVDLKENSTPAFVPSPENRWGFFVTGSGDFVNVGNDDINAHGYDITTGNVTVGADYRVCDHLAVGIDGGYSGSTADLVDRGRVEVDGGKAGAYATVFGYKILGSMIHIDGAVSGGWNSYDTHRTGLEDLPVLGSTNGSELNAMLAYGGDWHFGCLLIGTWSSLQYTNVNIDGFTETGSLAPLHIEDQDNYSLRGTTGVRLAYDIKAGRAIIRPEVRAAWQHESGDRAYPIDARFASGAGDVFTVHGPTIGRDSALVDAGIAVQLSNRCSIYAYYDGVLGRSNYDSHAVSGGVRFGF